MKFGLYLMYLVGLAFVGVGVWGHDNPDELTERIIFIVIGLAWIAITSWAMKGQRLEEAWAKRLESNGVVIEAKVESVTKCQNDEDQDFWSIDLHLKDPKSGTLLKFSKTWHGPADPTQRLLGKSFPVKMDPADPSNYELHL